MDERQSHCGFETYWERTGAPVPVISSQSCPERADYVIVGAGFTGLSAVLCLLTEKPDADVVVLEASALCQGASSRNGGMVGAHPRLSLGQIEKHFGRDVGIGVYKEASVALDYLKALIDQHAIACDFSLCGRIQLAWTKAALKRQEMICRDIARHTTQNVEMLGKSALDGIIENHAYWGGLYFHDHAAFHPQKFHVGLVNAVLKSGGHILPHCALGVIRPLSNGQGFVASTEKGDIECGHILIATNGYTKGRGVLRDFSARVFPVPSYIIATEPLERARLQRLAPKGCSMVETHPRHSYWRLSPDKTRVILGARASLGQISPARAKGRLQKILGTIWPDLRSVAISHSWKGNTGFSFSGIPWIGHYKGVYFAGGYSGGGTALAPYLGMKVARAMLGQEEGAQTAYRATELIKKRWFWGGHPWFLTPANIWYQTYVDKRENWRARRDRRG